MTRTLDRRSFFQAAGATGLALGSWSAVKAQASSDAPEQRRVVIGVMGLSRGAALAEGFTRQPNVEVRYVCDVDRNRADSCAERLRQLNQAPRAIGDFRHILDDPEVDALVCAAPNHWHAPATIMALSAGKHVYVEKPCSHNPWEGESMVQAARKHQRVVQMGTQRRSSPGTIAAIQRLHQGAIGRVYLSRCWYYNVRGSIGRGKQAAVPDYLDFQLWQGPAPRRPYVDNLVHYNWHWRWHWGNGELGNNGVHAVDLCRWGLGVDYPIRVTSSGGRYRYQDDQETPDTHTVCFEFEGNRAITWQGLSCNGHGDEWVKFYGDDGALDLTGNGGFTIYDLRGKAVEQYPGTSIGEAEHLVNFLQAVRSGDHQLLAAEIQEAHKSTLLCHLGNIAHRTGRTLNCRSTDGHILDDEDAMGYWQREYASGWEPVV